MTDKIEDHKVTGFNELIEIVRHGDTYVIAPPSGKLTRLHFDGPNRITVESLLAVAIDRLRGDGPKMHKLRDVLDLLRADVERPAFAKTEPPPQLPPVNTEPVTPLGALLKTTLDAAIDGTELPPDTTVTTQVNINKEPEEKLWPGQLAAKKGKK